MAVMRPSFVQTLFLAIFSIGTSSGNTSIRFQYSDKDLEDCVQHFEKHGDSIMIEERGESTSQNACLSLYEEFLNHFHPDISSNGTLLSPKYIQFVKTARLVHQHNTNHLDKGFKLRLNQFADISSYWKRDQPQIRKPVEERGDSNMDEDRDGTKESWQTDLEDFWADQKQDTDLDLSEDSNRRRALKLRWNEMDVRLLDTHSSIFLEMEHENERELHTHLRQSQDDAQQQQKQQENGRRNLWDVFRDSAELRVDKSTSHRIKVRMPGDGTNIPKAFSSPHVPANMYGSKVELHKGTHQLGLGTAGKFPLHQFSTSLDWSTSLNPDGIPLVRGAFDQGNCGSCWAFAATGSVEASAARNNARDYFVPELYRIASTVRTIDQQRDDTFSADDDEIDDRGYSTLLKELTNKARKIELETFQVLNLSVQELVDCDTSIDDGCVGGSPALAFQYIHKRGLMPWKEYPYVGNEQDRTTAVSAESTNNAEEMQASIIQLRQTSTCKREKSGNPIATVESWGMLHKDHEDLIEYALLYVGPVAVGINTNDEAFINYGGGIFDSDDCDQNANHALLIVGYGEEDITKEDGESETVRYWISRNSWGENWGENGFVRVKRRAGHKGLPGVCGIARSASVALGGVYRANRIEPMASTDASTNSTDRYRKEKYVTSYDSYVSPYNW
eukprot:CAMPEP_0197197446 /NCGR_PEP_ID=MMETSP1423-20130617/32871_1 /TAXON_ID=476441 /ORGANISM="Pseudo-nitzschia heimii, Strain UNC1101" /LENGTH=673 /DNA_ID=CAMNT_0042651267 /DNA_START=72 /DNA_END=2090 /DNA_ORIENTATION=+